MIYLVDIDGTIADISHRLHFIHQEPKDWTAFFKACVDDRPILNVLETVRSLMLSWVRVIFVTGRSDEVRRETIDWLCDHGFSHPDELYMRKAGDHRPDNVVKSELLDQILRDYPDANIAGVFEDRKQVVDMYRARGLTVFQVAEGNF